MVSRKETLQWALGMAIFSLPRKSHLINREYGILQTRETHLRVILQKILKKSYCIAIDSQRLLIYSMKVYTKSNEQTIE